MFLSTKQVFVLFSGYVDLLSHFLKLLLSWTSVFVASMYQYFFIWPLGLYGWSFTPPPSVVEEGRLGDKPKDCLGICGRLIIMLWWLNQAFKRNHAAKLCLLLNPLMPVLPATDRERESSLFLFWHHHLWLKLPLLNTQVLQEENIFPVIPRSEWLDQLRMKYAHKCSEIWVKNSEQNFPLLHLATLL